MLIDMRYELSPNCAPFASRSGVMSPSSYGSAPMKARMHRRRGGKRIDLALAIGLVKVDSTMRIKNPKLRKKAFSLEFGDGAANRPLWVRSCDVCQDYRSRTTVLC